MESAFGLLNKINVMEYLIVKILIIKVNIWNYNFVIFILDLVQLKMEFVYHKHVINFIC